MALPEDKATRIRCFRNALRNWRFSEYIRFHQRVQEWLSRELPAYSLPEIARLLYQHVEQGGEIDEQVETWPEYVSFEFHYDLRLIIGNRRIYFETLLFCSDPEDPDDPYLVVVSVHDV